MGSASVPEYAPATPKMVRSRNTVSPPAKMFSATPMMYSSDLNFTTNRPKNAPSSRPTASARISPPSQPPR